QYPCFSRGMQTMGHEDRRQSERQQKKSDWSWLDVVLECSELIVYTLRLLFIGLRKLLSHWP
ncbi:MAG: hypothetical protein ACM32O_04430, partial [Clostridia bacterium]